MRTLQIGLEWFPERAGGLPRYYYDLYKAASPEFEFNGLVLGTDDVAKATGGQVRAFASQEDSIANKLWNIRSEASRMVKERDIQLIVSHFALFSAPCVRLKGLPAVTHFHGPWASESAVEGASEFNRAIKKAVERFSYSSSSSFIVLSNAFSRVLSESYRVPEERINVVPGGVDFMRFNIAPDPSRCRDALGWPKDRIIILAVRRLVRRMGLEALIDAMRSISKTLPDCLLLIAGRGPLKDSLQRQIDENDLANNVRLVGFLSDEDLPRAYRAANMSVVPTQSLEGFGLIALESLASGTPVLVTPVGGLPEVVRPLSDALVLEGTSSSQLADRIVELLSRTAMPDHAECTRYASEFDWANIVPKIRNIYDGAIRK